MKEHHLKLFKELSEACGVSGQSTEVADIFLREAKRLGLVCSMDSLGSVSALIPSKTQNQKGQKSVLITAHIDNIGYIVLSIDKKERSLKLAKVGLPCLEGSYSCILRSSEKHYDVTVEDDGEGEVYFAFVEKLDKSIDIGSISVGDILYYNNPIVNKPSGKFTGAFMDNKASIMAMIMSMENLAAAKNNHHNLFFVLTSFEEIGAYGAMAAAQKIKPWFAINLDVFPVDTKNELTQGAVISCGYIYNPILVKYAVDLAKKNKVKHSVKVPSPDGESDANYIIKQNGGIPVCEIGTPCINVHLPDEIISKSSLIYTSRLLTLMCLNTVDIISLVPGGKNGL